MKQQHKIGDRFELDLAFAPVALGTDVPEGTIAGLASTPAMDLYGHKILAHAFDDSIKQKGLKGPRGIKLLAYHDWRRPAGIIKRLETRNDNLEIEALLNLNVSYVKDMYEAAKQNGGLNFSVGFVLEEFDWKKEDEDDEDSDEYLEIKRGDLLEVSVVTFPAQLEAEMTLVKQLPRSLAEFEKALVAEGLCKSRNEAHKLTLAVRGSVHLFREKEPAAPPPPELQRPLLDVHKLKAATDLVGRAKAILTSR